MTFSSRLRRWLTSAPARPEVRRGTPGVAGQDADTTTAPVGIEAYFLLDTPRRAEVQQVLAAVDLLTLFRSSDAPLKLTVVHREAPSAATTDMFDSTPGLACKHVTFEALGGSQAISLGLGHCWRDYAALTLARSVESEFYLVLDATSLCIRTFDPADLIEHGKAVTQWEASTVHPACEASAKALLKLSQTPGAIVSTFPFVLATKLAREALDRLEAANGARAETVLFEQSSHGRPWSANAVYSCSAGTLKLRRFHRPTDHRGVVKTLHSDINIWDDSTDLEGWNPSRWAQLATHGQFLVVKVSDQVRQRGILSKCYALVEAG